MLLRRPKRVLFSDCVKGKDMARLGLPDNNELTAEQQDVIAEVVSGRRGKVPAPMIAWLLNPELARRGQRLGELLRYETSLEPALSELAILVCGRHWTSHHEWTAHKTIALSCGIDQSLISAIAARKEPQFRNEREEVVWRVSRTLLADGRLDAALYERGAATLGKKGMVELVGIIGYYSLVALTLNAFEIGLPGSHAPELEDGDLN